MDLPKNAVVAVCDGEKLKLFRNNGEGDNLKLTALNTADLKSDNKSGGSRHQSSSANPDDAQVEEDSFAAAIAAHLIAQTGSGKIEKLVVIAAPKTLGELRKHYHKTLSAALLNEIAKDLTGRPVGEIEKAITAA